MSNVNPKSDCTKSDSWHSLPLWMLKGHACQIEDLVRQYQEMRKYQPPKGLAGPSWIVTEIAEVLDILLMRDGDWVRNNPEDHADISDEHLEEELGDVIFMAIYTGYVNGLHPLKGMLNKMEAKWPK